MVLKSFAKVSPRVVEILASILTFVKSRIYRPDVVIRSVTTVVLEDKFTRS